MSDYMDKLIHVGYTNKYQLDYAKDQEGYFYCDHDNECNIPLYMLTVHSFRAHNSVVVETHEAMQARIVELEKAISGILNSPHTKLTKGALLEVSEVDIDASIKALEK